MGDSTLDLGTVSGIQTYLSNTPFASDHITILSGGYSNFAYRIKLILPYDGRTTLVVKHSKSYVLAAGQKLPFDTIRQFFEVEALTRVKDVPSSKQLVTVPTVHRFDKQANVIIIDDCGEDALTLKKFMQDGRSNPSLSEEIGRALGEFIGNMHMWGRQNRPVLDLFETNEQGKTISAWATYGRLESTLTGKDDLPVLQDPPIDVSREQLEIIKTLSSERTLDMTSAREWFVMGDFWPGNILITLDNAGALKRIYILDWEVAKTGLPELDLGQFCAEMDLLRRFHPECAESAGKTISTFLGTYSELCRPDISFARRAITHWGVHLVAWVPRIPWGSKEDTRKTVEEGVSLLVEGYTGSDEWVKSSFVKDLC
ncbi:kinase-like domain-containing protein [Collybia nuda]|uniref:Kinase-like domain-containing protein n=1 Tax=Collybia nuda TaxID=64659 RepID=A0A9P5YGW4_9AGAR|nr:kinase-like domain-containing protein [Collybia nuda]